MGGGLINIVSYGANELFLTGNPQITFFKIVYRRYTNFSNQNYSFDLNGLEFGKENEFVISKISDMLGQVSLQINLPMFYINKSDVGIETDQSAISVALQNYNTELNNYNIIVDFMVLNMSCYRAAYNASLAQNATVENIQSSIDNAISIYDNSHGGSGASTTISNLYNEILNTNYNSQLWFLACNYSNLLTLYMHPNPNSPSILYSNVGELMSYLNICSDTSFKVQKYYYDNMKNKLNIFLDLMSANAKIAWVNNLAFSIIDYISVYIGGDEIDKHDGDWLNVWYQLSGNPNQREIYDSLIGNTITLTDFNRNTKPSYTLTLPLSFWFCRNIGLTLPLIALQNSDIRLLLKLKELKDCVYIEKNPKLSSDVGVNLFDIWQNNGYSLSGNYLIDYYFLDKIERRRFAQSAHEYLIETVQLETRDNLSIDELTVKHEMNFTGATKELIWFFQKNAYINNITNNYKSMWSNYSLHANNTGNILLSAGIKFGSYGLIYKTKASYYNLVQPYTKHTNYNYNGIYNYSFSLYPQDYQPSGECNLGKINSAIITFYIDPNAFYYYESDILPDGDSNTLLPTTLRYKLYSHRYTVLRIIGGFCSLAFR
jgi:hypothetical protein